MRLKLYYDVARFGLRQTMVFRTEVWVAVITKILRLASVIFLWTVVVKDSAVGTNLKTLLPYFLIADSVQVLVGGEWIRFGRQIINEVKLGTINNYLLRPVHPVFLMWFRFWGNRGVDMFLGIITLIAGWAVFPPTSPLSIMLFAIAIIVSVLMSFAFNVFVGSLSFWITEADGVKNAVSHVIRIFGGSLIPLTFFGSSLKAIVLYSPLPIFAYLPTVILQSASPSAENIGALFVSAAWAAVLVPLSLLMWQKGLKRYEAIGI